MRAALCILLLAACAALPNDVPPCPKVDVYYPIQTEVGTLAGITPDNLVKLFNIAEKKAKGECS